MTAGVVAACQQQPDFSKPGNDGGREKSSQRYLTYLTFHAGVREPACGTPYFFGASVSQFVFTCDNYDFTPLYERAFASGHSQAASLQCPQECPGPHTWESYRGWNCGDTFTPNHAIARVTFGALCPRPNDERPTGMTFRPSADDLKANKEQGAGDPPRRTGVQEEINDVQVHCPGVDSAEIDYYEDVPGCASLDYTPIVAHAEDKARLWHESIPCATGCVRQPYQARRRAWGCLANQSFATPQFAAKVRVNFDVVCRKQGD